MLISAVQKFTMLDYPGKCACIVFTPGCNFRCGYCHNPEFVLPEEIQKIKHTFIPEKVFFQFLQKREGMLDGVVITGGEPTMMGDLLDFMRKVKERGFLVKLDSNGNRPDILEKALSEGIVDYIAMDVKTSYGKYGQLVGKLVKTENIQKSIALLMHSNIEYEFRSTLVDEIHSHGVLAEMREMIDGARALYLQSFRPEKTLKSSYEKFHPFSQSRLSETVSFFREKIEKVEVRG
ncbi:anaerobic ribonucleoside-triphosphate reductase activating protein [Candidatus Nomurabacteria bacterium]|nr:anaerobic ribonucleoside-triphosphate reductase activating protein [Candidatus Nomurabacteria bacterium]